MKSNISILFGLIALAVVLLVSSFVLGGYGLLISSTLIAVGLADCKPNESNE